MAVDPGCAGGFEFAGNAFKVIGAAADIDDLKKVLASEFPSLKCNDNYIISRISLSATCGVSSWFVGIAGVVRQHTHQSCL